MILMHKIVPVQRIAAPEARTKSRHEKSWRWTLTLFGLAFGAFAWLGSRFLGFDGTDSAWVAIPSGAFIGMVLDSLRAS